MKDQSKKLFYSLISIQIIAFLWFQFAPDLVGSGGLMLDSVLAQEGSVFFDSLFYYLSWIQFLICLTLLFKLNAYVETAYCLVVSVQIFGAVLFGGDFIVSSIDGFVGQLQGLAVGATLMYFYARRKLFI